MRADVYMVHRNDGLLRALRAMLASERYHVRAAEGLDELLPELAAAGRSAVVVIDEEAAGPGWRERLDLVPDDIPCVVLTWYPWSAFPPRVTPLGKPFRARELMDLLAAKVERDPPGSGAGR